MSARQVHILALFAMGMTMAEVGDVLHLSRGAVVKQAARIYKALGARSKHHAVALGLRAGWIV
jgi:DNA-binding CsgD family transcriptional regulator